MAFAQGTVSGQIEFLQALQTFAAGVGFTVESYGVAPDNASDRQLTISHVRQTVTRFYTIVTRLTKTKHIMEYNSHTGFTPGNSIYNQPGAPNNLYPPCWSVPKTGAFECFFFGTGQFISAVARIGEFHQHMQFGQINLLGGYANGILVNSMLAYQMDYNDVNATYTFGLAGATSAANFMYGGTFRDHTNGVLLGPNVTNGGFKIGAGGGSAGGSSILPHLSSNHDSFFRNVPQNAAPPLSPIFIYALDPNNAAKFQLAGFVPGVFHVYCTPFASGTEIIIGSDSYLIFPAWTKTSGGTWTWQAACGLAYVK